MPLSLKYMRLLMLMFIIIIINIMKNIQQYTHLLYAFLFLQSQRIYCPEIYGVVDLLVDSTTHHTQTQRQRSKVADGFTITKQYIKNAKRNNPFYAYKAM